MRVHRTKDCTQACTYLGHCAISHLSYSPGIHVVSTSILNHLFGQMHIDTLFVRQTSQSTSHSVLMMKNQKLHLRAEKGGPPASSYLL